VDLDPDDPDLWVMAFQWWPIPGIERLTRVKAVPVSLGLPWGIWATGFVPFLPLPAKFTYKVGKPIQLRRSEKLSRNELAVRRVYLKVIDEMQGMLDDVSGRCRFPIIGYARGVGRWTQRTAPLGSRS